MKTKRQVLVIEDDQLFRELLVGWLERRGYGVLGAVGTLAEGKELAEAGGCDLVMLDLDLPDGDGMQFVEWELERRRTTRILALTSHMGKYPSLRLKKSGVMGALDKLEANGEELERALESVENWRMYFSEGVERRFRELVRETGAFYKTLSMREQELVKLFGRGYTNEAIAERLRLSTATVQGHRRNVMGKIGVRSTPELIIWALQNGFVHGPEIRRMERVSGTEGK